MVLISDVRDVNNPHDVFFKKSLEDLNVAKDFISNYLPAEITAMLDLNSLKPVPGSFVDDELRESFTDMLFKEDVRKVRTKSTSNFCVSLEMAALTYYLYAAPHHFQAALKFLHLSCSFSNTHLKRI
ncbi:Rpn family recombination-promoting nuclease/putative transposase [Peptococcaceae bacterium]|nr:Rpn family recombination-promoting nuclease/putative transposase [Peptococcaceae bacterium]